MFDARLTSATNRLMGACAANEALTGQIGMLITTTADAAEKRWAAMKEGRSPAPVGGGEGDSAVQTVPALQHKICAALDKLKLQGMHQALQDEGRYDDIRRIEG